MVPERSLTCSQLHCISSWHQMFFIPLTQTSTKYLSQIRQPPLRVLKFLFIYLFNQASSSSDYKASNGGLVTNKLRDVGERGFGTVLTFALTN
jgi:hypothetical protein